MLLCYITGGREPHEGGGGGEQSVPLVGAHADNNQMLI